MKKRIAYGIASAVALSSLGTPAWMAYAQSETVTPEMEVQKVEIKEPQDFVDLYCSLKLETKDEQGNIQVSYTVIQAVDRENYLQILDGKKIYDELDETMKEEINSLLFHTEIEPEKSLEKNYEDLYAEALGIQEQVRKEEAEKEEAEKPETDTPETEKPETDVPETTTETEKPSEDVVEEPKEEASKEESTTLDKEETEEVETNKEVQKPVVQTVEEKPVAILNIEPTVSEKVETPKPETSVLMATVKTTPAEKVEETVKVQPVVQEQKTALNQMDGDVQSFVKTYLTDANGNLYTSANAYNYQQILSGMTSYTSLSTAKVSQLNSYLVANGSQRYFSLVTQAQNIENGKVSLTPGNRVHTSTSSGFGLYGALLTLSGVGFGFLFKKSKDKKQKVVS